MESRFRNRHLAKHSCAPNHYCTVPWVKWSLCNNWRVFLLLVWFSCVNINILKINTLNMLQVMYFLGRFREQWDNPPHWLSFLTTKWTVFSNTKWRILGRKRNYQLLNIEEDNGGHTGNHKVTLKTANEPLDHINGPRVFRAQR